MKQNTAVICLSSINGGMELASIKIAKLLNTKVKTFLVCKKDSYILSQKKTVSNEFNIDFYEVEFSSNFSFKLIKQIRSFLIKENIKNIIFLGASEMKSLYFATLGLDINFIVRQGTTKSTPKKDIFHKLFYSNVNYFIGNSEYIKKNILKILPIPKKAEVKTIYASLALEKSSICKESSNKIKILHTGRITRGKGQLDAIKACEILYKNNIDFELNFLGTIYDEKYFEEIEIYLKDSKIKENINFKGFCDVKPFLENSNIFLFPTLGEGMSNSVIEALSHGLITIVYNNTSLPELENLGFNIHLVENKNINILKETLLNSIKDIKNENRLFLKNNEKALEVFSSIKEQENYLKLLV